jgi:hypothetical protein
MAYLIEVPVEGGGRLLVEACEADMPRGLELAAMGPDEVGVEFGIVPDTGTGAIITKGTTEVHFTVTLTWKRTGPDADTAEATGDAGH